MAARKIPTVPQRALANALERRREAAGLSREDVNSALEWSSMKCYRIETARVTVSPGDIRELARLYHLERRRHRGAGRAGPAGQTARLVERHVPVAARGVLASTWSWNRPPAPSAPTRPSSSPACGRPRTTPARCSAPAASAAPPSRSSGRSPSGCAASRSWTAPARRRPRSGRSWMSR